MFLKPSDVVLPDNFTVGTSAKTSLKKIMEVMNKKK
jgi:hypothetical protein